MAALFSGTKKMSPDQYSLAFVSGYRLQPTSHQRVAGKIHTSMKKILHKLWVLTFLCGASQVMAVKHPLNQYWDINFKGKLLGSANAVAVSVDGNTVYYGGTFDSVQSTGVPGAPVVYAESLAKVEWILDNGTTGDGHWTVTPILGLGSGVTVNALCLDGTKLYVGGTFSGQGNNVAVYNLSTSTWQGLGAGVNGEVRAIAKYGNSVYVGGAFSSPGNNVARWDVATSAWGTLGSGVNGKVNAATMLGSTVFFGGEFTSPAPRVFGWNGAPVYAGGLNGPVNALASNGTDLYAGGDFTVGTSYPSGYPSTVKNVAICSFYYGQANWGALGTGLEAPGGGLNSVRALAVSGSDVFASGDFDTAGGLPASGVAKFRAGQDWIPLGQIIFSDRHGDFNGLAVKTSTSGDTKEYSLYGACSIQLGDGFSGSDFTGYSSQAMARWRVRLTDVGILPGWTGSSAFALNDSVPLKVVGDSTSGNQDRGFVWTESANHLSGTRAAVPYRNSPVYSQYAYSINDSGLIVGANYWYYDLTGGYVWSAFNYQDGSGAPYANDMGGYSTWNSVASDVNNNNPPVTVGLAHFSQPGSWDSPTANFTGFFNCSGNAVAINDNKISCGNNQPSSWSLPLASYWDANKNWFAIPGAAGPGYAQALNNGSYIDGVLDTSSYTIVGYHGSPAKAFAYRPYTAVLADLSAPANCQSFAYGINKKELTVGYTLTSGNVARPFIAYPDLDGLNGTVPKTYDLNKIVLGSFGWSLTYANDINEAGAIVGQGTVGSVKKAFLLRP
jgi:hypothetical protein